MAVMFILMPRAIFSNRNDSGTMTDGTNPIPEVSISLVTFDDGHTKVLSAVYISTTTFQYTRGNRLQDVNKAGYGGLKSNVVKDEKTTTVDAVLSTSRSPISGAALSLDNRYITITFSGVWEIIGI